MENNMDEPQKIELTYDPEKSNSKSNSQQHYSE